MIESVPNTQPAEAQEHVGGPRPEDVPAAPEYATVEQAIDASSLAPFDATIPGFGKVQLRQLSAAEASELEQALPDDAPAMDAMVWVLSRALLQPKLPEHVLWKMPAPILGLMLNAMDVRTNRPKNREEAKAQAAARQMGFPT